MRRTHVFPLTILALFLSFSGCGQPASQNVKVVANPPPPPFPIIDLRGSGEEIGTSHGRALGGEILGLFRAYFGQYFSGPKDKAVAMLAASSFSPHVLPEHRAEINALAAASGIQPAEAMLAQCFLDLSNMVACSSVTLPAGASPDNVARFARNLDFPSFDVADKHSVVLVYHPKNRYQFAEIGWPGMVGVLSGMNEHGLTLANMEVDRSRRMPQAMPYTLLYRAVLEQCRTVDEAITLLEKTPRQTANNLMLMDGRGDRAVVELTPKSVHVRRAPADQALVSTNHQRGQDLKTPGYCPRYDAMTKTSADRHGKLDVKALQQLLGKVAQGRMTLQSMIFEPSNRVIYLAVGAAAHKRAFHKIDLNTHFDPAGVASR